MLLGTTEDQDFFRENTRRFLQSHCPPGELRRLRDDPDGFDRPWWRQGAELGWTSLLVPEEAGGGSISGDGLADLDLVAFEFGHQAAPGPLVPTNLVAGALAGAEVNRAAGRSRPDGAGHTELLGGLVSGELVAAWVPGGPESTVRAEKRGEGWALSGRATPVEAAGQADWLLVSARTGAEWQRFLVPADAPGVQVRALQGIDLTRRWGAVELSGLAVGPAERIGEGNAGEVRLRLIGLCLQLHEMVGAMQAAFDMTSEWAANRYSFGRPLASYQEIKHRFADMRMWLEASYAITAAATAAVSADAADGEELASAAKAYVATWGPELVQDCVQIHGGIGVTFDHDLHLYLRRVAASVPAFGGPARHQARLAEIIESRRGDRVA